ncbi:MAG UNVERIFIED_CONTAM: hypothetical protein LVR18_10405 [Planctomycetaceae bacterium]
MLESGLCLNSIGDDPRVGGIGPGAAAIERLLDHGAITGQSQELFGELFSALGPEPSAASAGHDDCMQHLWAPGVISACFRIP